MTRLAYLVGRYPAISHTFITREVQALRALGAEIETFSVWRTPDAELLAPADRGEAAATRVLLPPTQRWVAEAQAAAATASPRGFAELSRRALALSRPGARGRAVAASWVIEAAALWHACEERGVRHVHAHLNGTAPSVALLCAAFGNAVGGSAPWTWSMTVHGPSDFYDVWGEALPEKVRAATFVVAISDFARSQLMAFADESDWSKLHVVHCGVDPGTFAPVPRDGRGGPIELLSVGRLTQVKGQAVALEAMSLLRERGVDARLTIVGDGPKRSDLERLVSEHGLGGRVEIAGAVGQDRIRDYYDRADAFVLASFAEGIPVVLMEAMAAELPVVAPAVMGVPELVRHGDNGLLARPGRADEYAAAIERLARDAGERAALGRAGRATVETEFAIDDSARRLAHLFSRYAS